MLTPLLLCKSGWKPNYFVAYGYNKMGEKKGKGKRENELYLNFSIQQMYVFYSMLFLACCICPLWYKHQEIVICLIVPSI